MAGNIRNYVIGDYPVNKDGVLDYRKHMGLIELLLKSLTECGFACELLDSDNAPE